MELKRNKTKTNNKTKQKQNTIESNQIKASTKQVEQTFQRPSSRRQSEAFRLASAIEKSIGGGQSAPVTWRRRGPTVPSSRPVTFPRSRPTSRVRPVVAVDVVVERVETDDGSFIMGTKTTLFFYNVRSLPAKKNWFLRNIHFRANKKKVRQVVVFIFKLLLTSTNPD